LKNKKIPSPCDYNNLIKAKIIGSKFTKTSGLNFMSETEFLGNCSPSSSYYDVKDEVIKKRCASYRIIKPKGNRMGWKPVKDMGAAVGLYETTSHLVMPKSPGVKMGKDKIKSIIDEITKQKKKIPSVGNYDIVECYNKISRPMRTSRC
jgi:hypothetical protein